MARRNNTTPRQKATTSNARSQNVVTPRLACAMAQDDVADLAAAVVPVVASTVADDARALAQKQAALLEDAFRRVKTEEESLEMHLFQVTNQIAALKQKARTRHRSDRKLDKSLEMQQELIRRLSLLGTRCAAMTGSWAADVVAGGSLQRDLDKDWPLVDAVLRSYPELEEARKTIKSGRTRQQEVLFKKKLLAAYGVRPTSEGDLVHCPITNGLVDREVAAHIVDVNVGARTAEALFGEGEDHIWSPRNGLVIHEAYEKLIDDAKAVILPASDRPDETEFVLHLLTRDIRKMKAHVWGYETLHGRRLTFLNNHRPAKQYLYFKATMSLLLLLRRANVDGHSHGNNLDLLSSVAKMMWASPGPPLKRAILLCLARELGCLTKEDADRFWDTDAAAVFDSLTLEEMCRATALAHQASSAALTGGSTNEDEDEDEYDELEGEDSDDPFQERWD